MKTFKTIKNYLIILLSLSLIVAAVVFTSTKTTPPTSTDITSPADQFLIENLNAFASPTGCVRCDVCDGCIYQECPNPKCTDQDKCVCFAGFYKSQLAPYSYEECPFGLTFMGCVPSDKIEWCIPVGCTYWE